MRDDERDDRITKLLGAVHADAEPALWTRALARIEEREHPPARGWVAWLMRPAALGGSLALLAVAIATSLALVASAPRATTTSTTGAETLEDALVVELESGATAGGGTSTPAPDAATDSGAAR
jgi:hypothetical protein